MGNRLSLQCLLLIVLSCLASCRHVAAERTISFPYLPIDESRSVTGDISRAEVSGPVALVQEGVEIVNVDGKPKFSLHYQYEYDRTGRLVRYLGNGSEVWAFSYDSTGKRIASRTQNHTERVAFTTYEYDDRGLLQSITKRDSANRGLHWYRLYEYDSQGRLIGASTYFFDGSGSVDIGDTTKAVRERAYDRLEYGTDGSYRISAYIDYGGFIETMSGAEFDQRNKLVRTFDSSSYDGLGHSLSAITSMERYDDGRVTGSRMITYSGQPDPEVIDYSYNYEFDKTGNWLRQIRSATEKGRPVELPFSVRVRKISYYSGD